MASQSIQNELAPHSQLSGTPFPKTLLIVDDEPNVIHSIERVLRREDLQILSAGSGAEGMEIIKHHPVGVVLSDQNMPAMDGISFLEKVREFDDEIVRIMLTGYASVDNAIDAINRTQIFEFLTKPWDSDILKTTVQRAFGHHLLTKENRRLQRLTREQNRQLRQLNSGLEKRVAQRTQQLADAMREGILMLSLAAEARDDDTGEHVKRIQYLTEAICLKIGIPQQDAEQIGFFSMMHDVGKIHIPDRILKKPGTFTEEERQIMQHHTIAGERILGDSSYYAIARQIARSHHEWLDGSGYPDGLKGSDIPLPARIVAVADVFDALTHTRVYKKAWPVPMAVDEINKRAGKQFDTDIVEAFIELVSDGLCEGLE
jgi:response regulator RpfG family c-di-GMP phosphodiesterase